MELLASSTRFVAFISGLVTASRWPAALGRRLVDLSSRLPGSSIRITVSSIRVVGWVLLLGALLAGGPARGVARGAARGAAHGAAHGAVPTAAGSEAPAAALRWEAEVGRTLGLELASGPGMLAVSARDRRIALFALPGGERLWEKKLEGGVQAGVAIQGGAIYGVTDYPDGRLFCRQAGTGRLRWDLPLGESWGAPLLDDRRLFAASLQGRVVCCDVATGDPVWERRVPGLVRAKLGLADSILWVPTVSNRLLALAARTGETLWDVEPGGALYGPPALLDSLAWTLSYDGHLRAWRPATGELAAGLDLDGRFSAGPVAGAGSLFLVSAGGVVRCYDDCPPVLRWERDLETAADLRPTLADGTLWVPLRDGAAYGLDPDSGEILWRLRVPAPAGTRVLPAEGLLLLGGGRGDLFAFALPDGASSGAALPRDGAALPRDGAALRRDGAALPRDGAALPVGAPTSDGGTATEMGGVLQGLTAMLRDAPRAPSDTECVPLDSERVPLDSERVPLDSERVPSDSERISSSDRGLTFAQDTAASGSSLRPHPYRSGGLDHLRKQFTPVTESRSWRPGAGELWAAAWLAGTALAFHFQDVADDAYEEYRRHGQASVREDGFDKAQRYDRYALSAWIGSEVFFLLALREWLWDSPSGDEGR